MQYAIKFAVIATAVGLLFGCSQNQSGPPTPTIGIIEPLEHEAMDEIVAGFTETMKKDYGKTVIVKVENAQNDLNLQRSIIQKMHDVNYTMIAPIGVGATQMSLAMVHDLPVISLASNLSDSERRKLPNCHVAVVQDEIEVNSLLAFIHASYPQITQLTLIHSAADKVFPEVKEAVTAGKKLGIKVDTRMIASLPEIYSAAQSLPNDTQALFVLKDSLIVSGMPTLAKIAAARHIPLIASDQGSVQNGAAFALGVHEKEIGIEGAKLAIEILKGKSSCDLPIVQMKNLTVFINPNAMRLETQAIKPILTAAKDLDYQSEIISDAKG